MSDSPTQAIYFRLGPGTGWLPRITSASALGAAAAVAYLLLALAIHLARRTSGTPSATNR